MREFLHFVYFIALGSFWGLTPSLYRFMGDAGVPLTHIVVYTGLGVGIALAAVAWLVHGRLNLAHETVRYSFICATLLNVPFGLSLFFARYVHPAEYALIVSSAPIFNYLAGYATGRESATPRRLAAVTIGFISSAILILSRHATVSSGASLWTAAAFSVPLIYVGYNWYAARHWPKDGQIFTVGALESLFSALVAFPFFIAFAAPWARDVPPISAYWAVLAATAMWIVERMAFFTLIRDKGALYTIQAVYVATPAGVIFAFFFFGGHTDRWIWLSLAFLMLALWLNNAGAPMRPARD